ncbi:unnamed protein product [Bemisia tabaci]|uniref:Uncharacterized protein n=1 Tax=Bemisia tabaci TaxID=7038 RepID=A0A9P0A695_BEMTA|nr:PREDICTED: uncharacterized protein LOC109040163 [Bemisia tabaci]CAH0384048.1 unnamed protein product [Bemisia tabaci]
MEKSSTDCYQLPSACQAGKPTAASASHSCGNARTRNSSSACQTVAAALICIVAFSLIAIPVESALLLRRINRAISADTTVATDTKPAVKECLHSTPCGWAVYTPFTRRTDYYMKNTCECPKDKKCQQTDDNLSASAYVYRCRIPEPRSNSTDLEVEV